jgi:uncharacterized repeat protein (TIGR01451 family)
LEIIDNDSAGFTTTLEDTLILDEAGGSSVFTVQLDAATQSIVTFIVTSSDESEVIVTPSSLNFTAQNWNQAQTVTITSVDDTIDRNDKAIVTLAIDGSSDVVFRELSARMAHITLIDNETAVLERSPINAKELNTGRMVSDSLHLKPVEKLGLAQLSTAKDIHNSSSGYVIFIDRNKEDKVSFTSGRWSDLGDSDGLINYAGDKNRGAYIDIDGDNQPDIYWNPDMEEIQPVSLAITGAKTGEEEHTINNIVGLPIGHEKAIAINNQMSFSGCSLNAEHSFELWGYHSDGVLGPVTTKITSSNAAISDNCFPWVVTPNEFIKSLDFGNNVLVAKGSVSTPLPITVAEAIRLTKQANRQQASVGSIITYTLDINNAQDLEQSNIAILDDLPPGFVYVANSARWDNDGKAETPMVAIEPVSIDQGDGIQFTLGTIPKSSSLEGHKLLYQLRVSSGVNDGIYTNTAVAVNNKGTVTRSDDLALSHSKSAEVTIVPDALFSLSTVVGKVFDDINGNGLQDAEEQPVAYASLLTSAGQQITTDIDGQYHLTNVRPGRMVISIDAGSLPSGTVIVGRHAQIVDIGSGIPAKINFAVQLPDSIAAHGAPRFSMEQLSVVPQPRLHLDSFGPLLVNLMGTGLIKPIELRMYSNYPTFIEHWQLQIVNDHDGSLVKAFTGDRYNFYAPIYWNGVSDAGQFINPQHQYKTQLTVTDAEGHQAITVARPLPVSTAAEPLAYEYDQWLQTLAQQDSTQQHDIRVTGKTVTISAQQFNAVRVIQDGVMLTQVPHYQKNNDNRAQRLLHGHSLQHTPETIELILPLGKLQVEVLDAASTGTNHRSSGVASGQPAVTYPETGFAEDIVIGPDVEEYFLVGIVDGEVGYQSLSGNLELAKSGASRYSERLWKDGKIQLYFKGTIEGDYLVTASLDSERGANSLFNNLDPDATYAVYGDNSSVTDLAAQTDDMLYLLIEKDASWAKWGRLQTALNRTDLTRFERSLQGAQIHYVSPQLTANGAVKTQADIFTAASERKNAHNEFLVTGSSLYYLKHQQVEQHSLRLRLEQRDPVHGTVTSSLALVAGQDYEFYPAAGRIAFWQPPRQISASESPDEVMLIADYSYRMAASLSRGVSGGRVQQEVGDNITVGLTHINEQQKGGRYLLEGVDADIQLGPQHSLHLEYGRSQSRAEPRYISNDGGLNWSIDEAGIVSADQNKQGNAMVMRGSISSADKRTQLDYYGRRIDENFSSNATHHQQGQTALGMDLRQQYSERLSVHFSHDQQTRLGSGNVQSNHRTGAQRSSRSNIETSYQVDHRLALRAKLQSQSASGIDIGSDTPADRTSLDVEGNYEINHRTNVSLGQKISLTGTNDNQTRGEISHQLTPQLAIEGHLSHKQTGNSYGVDGAYAMNEQLTLNAGLQQNSIGLGSAKLGADYRHQKLSFSGGLQQHSNGATTTALGTSYNPDSDTQYRLMLEHQQGANKDNNQSVMLGTRHANDANTTIETGVSLSLSGQQQRSSIDGKVSRDKGQGQNVYATVSRYTHNSSAADDNNGYEVGIGGDLNHNWSAFFTLGQGDVHRLTGDIDSRDNLVLGLGYSEQQNAQRQGRVLYEVQQDRGHSNRNHHRLKLEAQTKLNRDTTLLMGLDRSEGTDLDQGMVDVQNNRWDLGFAYRPVLHDRFNFIGKYSWLDNHQPQNQQGMVGLEAEKAQIFALDLLVDVSSRWSLGSKLALRNGQEKIAHLPWAHRHLWMAAGRVEYMLVPDSRIKLEYRYLQDVEAQAHRSGAAVEFVQRFNDLIEAAIGINRAGFDDDLTDLDYRRDGVYLRVSGALGG